MSENPSITVIIPVYRVLPYLRECLESVLGQSFTDFEIIAVDDCSPDGCAELLDEYAARDARLRVLHLAQNEGLGPARNKGLEQACGDYIMFLDSDDTLLPDALGAVIRRVEETNRPDLVLFDYARTYWSGMTRRNLRHAIIRSVEQDGIVTAQNRPDIFRLLMVVWNKAYRRDFLEGFGLRFPSGYYEDVPFTYESLLSARSIAAIDAVLVHYRQRRNAGILRTRSRRHFDAFDQWTRIFDFVERHPEFDHWRPMFLRRMLDHCLYILRHPRRLLSEDRAEFFHRASSHYLRYVTAGGYEHPAGQDRWRFLLLQHDAHRTYEMLRLLGRVHSGGRRTRRGMLRRLVRVRASVAGRIYRWGYRWQRQLPLDPALAAYSVYWDRGYSCNPAAIYEKARELAPQITGVWVVKPGAEAKLPAGTPNVHPGTRAYFRLMARATFFFNNVNFGNEVVKRPGQIHLQTQHGTPLKTMGIDLRQYPVAAKGMKFHELLRRADRWDFHLSPNCYASEVWGRCFPNDYEMLEYGYPRNDRYYNATAAEIVSLREDLNIDPDKIAVLYAPTHRDYESGFRERLDLERLCAGLGDRFVLLIRAHYFYRCMGNLDRLAEVGLVRNVSAHPRVEDLALASDLLVTDYSSIMFDYANLDRPIVIYADDWDTYRKVRGVYFDLTAEPPGPVARTEDELLEILRSGAWGTDDFARLRAVFRDRFCQFDDGQSAERVVRRVLLDEEVTVPNPAFRPAPAPRPRFVLTGLRGEFDGTAPTAFDDLGQTHSSEFPTSWRWSA